MVKRTEQETRFELGDYRAELLKSETPQDGWYAVVQPRNSSQIVAIERFPTYEGARLSALETLERLQRLKGPD